VSEVQQENLPQPNRAPSAAIAIAKRYRIPAAIIGLVVAPFAGRYASIALYLLVAGILMWAGYNSPGSRRRSTDPSGDSGSMRERQPVLTIIACVVCLLVMMRQQAGFILMLLLPILAFYFPYAIGVIWGQPARRKMHGLKLTLWFITVSTIAGMHLYYYRAAQADADEAVAAVMRYHARVGEYPLSLADAGISSEQELLHKWHLHYSARGGDPVMLYFSTFMIFCVRDYDFRTQAWGGHCD
jgi:hypothetical protein